MSWKILFIKLLLLHYATQSQERIVVNCNEDVPLKCSDFDFNSMDFLSVTWYKQLNIHKKLGIIRKGKGDVEPQYYNFNRSAQFVEKYSLLLRGVTPEDSGTYECAISANVGGKNHNPRVNLHVNECVTQADLTTMTNVLDTTQSELLQQQSTTICNEQVEELPVMWSIIGYVAVGLTKIILSIISIGVIRAIRIRSSRRQQQKW